MPYVDPEFEIPTIPEDELYEGTDVDGNVLNVLPAGTKIIWVATHGASFWATSTKIDTELPDGSQQSYFMKVYTTVKSQAQALGEYESTKALHAVIPENVPRPVAVGVLSSDPSKHFIVFEFKDMAEELPPAPEFAEVIAKLHRDSLSPNGKFGFQVPTSQSLQLDNAWCDTWEEFFTRHFRETVKLEQQIQGHSDELEMLAETMTAKIIPRLLAADGDGRTDNKANIDQTILYDSCAFYGHNEYDLGMWRAARYRTNLSHVRAYHKLIEFSEPIEDHDDRNALYALRVDLDTSCAWSANKRMRQLAMEEMKRLIDKYPGGLDGDTDAKIKENETFIARLQPEAAKRPKDIHKAEEAADEALLRFGTKIQDFPREAVAVAPHASQSANANEVLFESKNSSGKRRHTYESAGSATTCYTHHVRQLYPRS